MDSKHLITSLALLAVLGACNGGTSTTPDPGADAADAAGGDSVFDISFPEVLPADATADGALDSTPLDGGDVAPACEVGEGCFGDPCEDNKDCLSGWCVDHLGDTVCTDTCQEECPPGWSCKQAGTDPDVVWICVSDHPKLCVPCATDTDCVSLTGIQAPCIGYDGEGAFCGGGCDGDADCPAGYTCAEVVTVSGASLTQCVSQTGTCDCTGLSVALGLATPCAMENELGICDGFRVCTDAGLSACDAAEPAAELCNGLDDDCDGEVDEEGCDDGNPCTEDLCHGGDGCEHVALNDVECPDGDLCTVGDQCDLGVCVGAPVVCDDGNPCTDETCDPETGDCVFTDNLLPCDDADPCTVADGCKEGACVGVPIDCDCLTDADCGKLEDGDLCNGTLVCDTESSPHLCVIDPDTLIDCPPPSGPDAPCLAPACDPGTGACGFAEGGEGVPCDDQDPCSVADVCEKGECLAGVPANCNDGNPCTDDSCAPGVGCLWTPNTVPCEDGDVCTVGDQCEGGECVHGPLTSCDDGNPCTDDACDSAVGCAFVPNAAICDDGNICTPTDMCLAGACVGLGSLDCDDGNPCTKDLCLPDGGCDHDDVAGPCSDDDPCTLNDTCAAGACVPGPMMDCDDDNPCTDDACDLTGTCQSTPNQADCDDGNACTEGDYCDDGACLYEGLLGCDDGNLCTTDHCDPVSGCGAVDNSNPCDDGDACTTGDLCGGGVCQGVDSLSCDDGNICTDDSCDPDTGCVHVDNTAPCTDGNKCTDGDECLAGACTPGTAVSCDDADVCTTDSCSPTTGCVYTLNSNPCDDDDACTVGDTCDLGVCTPLSTLDCDDGNPCTDDACDPVTGCKHVDNVLPCDDGNSCTTGDVCGAGTCAGAGSLDCDDGNPCTQDSCLPGGGCSHSDLVGACNDGDPCTINDACAGGLCVSGAPMDCDDGNVCTDDFCDLDGTCQHMPNTAACSDGNPCTLGDHCAGGSCTSDASLICDDDNPCTTEYCAPATGCVYSDNSLPCTDGDACTTGDICSGGSCTHVGLLACNDGNLCTTDSCDPATGCVFTNNTMGCNDGDACTTGDACSGGSCVSTGILSCDDGEVCTTDSCNPATGCVFTNNSLGCSDGNVCTTGDGCAGGTCTATGTLSCVDGDPCTTDSCAPASGCLYVPIAPCCGNDVTEPPETCDDGNQTPGDGCDASCQTEAGGCVILGQDVRTLEQGPEDWQLDYCNAAYCENTPTVIPAGWHIATFSEVGHLAPYVKFGSCAAYGICGAYWYGGGVLTSSCSSLSYNCTTGGCVASTSHCYTQVLLIRDGKDGTCHTGG